MLHPFTVGVDDSTPHLSTVALADDRCDEMELDDRRAMLASADAFDPSGLYALEQERDLAASLLAETVKSDVTLSRTSNVHHVGGRWLCSTEWVALIFQPTSPSLRAIGKSPTEAVNSVLEQWRKLNAPVRTRPEARGVTAESFEAFGKIEPADADDFADFLASRSYTPDFLTVLSDGRITLRSGAVDDIEAMEVGQIVADFVFTLTPGSTTVEDGIRVIVEQTGDTYKSWVILANGERIRGARCFTEPEARKMGEKVKRAQRPTVADVAKAQTVTPAA
jgi:hypothetical protein